MECSSTVKLGKNVRSVVVAVASKAGLNLGWMPAQWYNFLNRRVRTLQWPTRSPCRTLHFGHFGMNLKQNIYMVVPPWQSIHVNFTL